MLACRICLNTNSRFYHSSKYCLQSLYEELTGYSFKMECFDFVKPRFGANLPQCYCHVSPSDGLPQYFCFECAYRLHTSVKFKRKAITSCNVLTELLKTNVNLNRRTFDANCKKNNFESTLCAKHFKVNHYDIEIDDDDANDEANDETNDEYKIDELIEDVTRPLDDDEINSLKDYHAEYKDENEPNDLVIDIKNEDSNHSFYKSDDSFSSSDIVLAKRKTVAVKKKKVSKKTVSKNVNSEKTVKARQRFKQIISEEIFTITDLNPDEQMQDILKRKESRNFKYSEFKCMECFKGFLDQEAYKSHMIRHTDQSGPYVCDVCKVHFRNKYAVRNHAKAHLQKFSCRQCPYVTSRRHAAILHEKYHNGTKYQCPHCKEEFSIAGTYMSHVRLKHTSRHVCLICGHTFVSDKGLELHTQLKHRFEDTQIPEDGPFCEQCSLRFASDEALQRHMITSAVHNLNGESREALSKKSHLNKTDGRKQRKRCKPDDPITCEQCDAQLPDSLSYFRHFRRQHPDKNRTHYPSKRKSQAMCEVCGKLFQSLALLQDHSWTHTDSKPFKCNLCNKSFQRKYRLIAHRRIHGNQRASYACTVCGKRFSTSSNMQRHMFSHTGLKPFKCEMCGKCFKHSSEKRAHITYVHLKKPWPKRSRGKRPDDRQPQMQSSMASDIDIVQPLWPACTM